jgi:uncharacterized protein
VELVRRLQVWRRRRRMSAHLAELDRHDRETTGHVSHDAGLDQNLDFATVELKIVGVRVEQVEGKPDQPILLLKEAKGERYLAIWIGTPEANAIAIGLKKMSTAMPMTHDLIKRILDTLLTVELLAISELKNNTYKGAIRLSLNGARHDFSARPSNLAALATRLEMPIFTSVEIMEQSGLVFPGGGWQVFVESAALASWERVTRSAQRLGNLSNVPGDTR